MTYKVYIFHRGEKMISKSVEAADSLSAAKTASGWVTYWTHIAVTDDKDTFRYNKGLELVLAEPKFSKVRIRKDFYAIVAMFDNIPEIYPFAYKSKRDEAFEKCTTSTSAVSVSPEAEQTGITVSSDETNASKSGSTSPKISNGSVTNVTWQDVLILENTAKPSGTGKPVATVTNTWYVGSKVSHSSLPRILYATVLPLRGGADWPGTNSTMASMVGKSYKFKKTVSLQYGPYYKNGDYGYTWLPKWLDADRIWAKIKTMPAGLKADTNTGAVIYDNKHAGEVVQLTKCGCGCGTYFHDNIYYKPEWLDVDGYGPDVSEVPPKEIKAKVITPNLGGKMSEMFGKVYRFRKVGSCWSAEGYLFVKEWLEEVKE